MVDKTLASQIKPLDALAPESAKRGNVSNIGSGPKFEEYLKENLQTDSSKIGLTDSASIKFSAHAIDRIRSRNINLGPEKLDRINQAVAKAALKGSKNTLVLLDDNALVVNVKKQTVITAMDKNMMKENVFTNIDSTVIA